MDDSVIDLDLYSKIIEYSSWSTLHELKFVNNLFYYLSKKEIIKRLKSKYPFGDSKAKLCIITRDIYLDSIFCIIDEQKIFIPQTKYKLFWVLSTINSWFFYSIPKQEHIITSKLFKSIIRICNKKTIEGNQRPIDEHRQTMLFILKNEETVLEDIF